MESLALVHTYVAHEDPNPEPQVRSLQEFNKMVVESACVGLAAVALGVAVVGNAPKAEAAGFITVEANSGLNIRSGPGSSYSIIGGLSDGAIVATTGAYQNGWVQLQQGGWISASYTNLGGSGGDGSGGGGGSSSDTVTVTAGSGLRIRSGPGTGYSVVGGLPYGSVVDVYGSSNGWLKVSGGWIAGAYTSSGGGGGGGGGGEPGRRVTVSTSSGIGINARYGPGLGYGIGAGYADGAVLYTTGESSNGWWELTNGLWVSSAYVY